MSAAPPPDSAPEASASAVRPPTTAVALLQPLKRNEFGSKGRPVRLLCNHFKVRFNLKQDVVHYHVSFSPSVNQKVLHRAIMNKLNDTYGAVELRGKKFAYDGENGLYTVGRLDFQSKEFLVILEEGRKSGGPRPRGGGETDDEAANKRSRPSARPGSEFTVTIKFAAVVNMSSIDELLHGRVIETAQDALRVLDIVLREHATRRGYLLVRESYFHSSLGAVGDLGEGVQAWQGFHVSIRPGLAGLTLNFDSSTTTVLKPEPVDEFLCGYMKKNITSFRQEDWSKARRILKGVRVETTHSHTSQKHKFFGFSSEPMSQLTFVKKRRDDQGNLVELPPISVKEYFTQTHNYSFKYPDLPAMDVGRANKPVYLPLEVCRILPGQRYTKKLSGSQTAKNLLSARQSPDDRKNMLQQALASNAYEKDDLIREFGVEVDKKLASIQGRQLESPSVRFGGDRDEVPRGGRWNFNNKTMLKGAEIPAWAVLNFCPRVRDAEAANIADQLKECCKRRGMVTSDIMAVVSERQGAQGRPPLDRVDELIGQLKSKCTTRKPKLLLCLLPERKVSDLYAPIKRICETRVGIITQCIVPPRPLKDQYLTNVALKINAKLGGYNSLLSMEAKRQMPRISSVPTIIFGLDVSHGSPGDADSPSIAAVVASRGWPRISQYAARVRSQSSRDEMIDGLYEEKNGQPAGMIRDHLAGFYQSCKTEAKDPRPAQIIIYRDGVSESQFEKVLQQELSAFKKACSSLGDYNPKITFIVVQKRHHTRFFPEGGSGNVQPGTVIDRDVCHPRNNDFYLCSHAGLIGTSRPTHYHILYDENNFTPDELQNLSNNLCYTYAKCTTAVSVVPPAYYAHLAATRGRCYLDHDGSSGSETSSLNQGRQGERPPRQVARLPELKEEMLNSMFFC